MVAHSATPKPGNPSPPPAARARCLRVRGAAWKRPAEASPGSWDQGGPGRSAVPARTVRPQPSQPVGLERL